MIKLTDNFDLNKPAHLDSRVGPYIDVETALNSIPYDKRVIGLTIVIDDGTGAIDYWFKNGIDDGDFELKSSGGGGATWGGITGTLSSQTDLQTALDGKFNNPTGTTSQYLNGVGTPTDFPTTGQSGTLVRQIRNESGSTLTKGTIVYISGASGNKALVSKAIATSDSTSAQTFGLIQSDIPNNQNGICVVRGELSGLDTSSFSEGAQLYLSPTTAGTYTSTKQFAPNHLVYIGIVTRSHVNQGSIEVAIQNGYEMDELHNVSAQTPSNRHGLFWNSSSNLWESRLIVSDDLPTLDKSKVGLGNVDNTSDLNKPISTATQTALDGKSSSIATSGSVSITITATGSANLISLTGHSFTINESLFPVGATIQINGMTERISGTGIGSIAFDVNGTKRYITTPSGHHYQYQFTLYRESLTTIRLMGGSNAQAYAGAFGSANVGSTTASVTIGGNIVLQMFGYGSVVSDVIGYRFFKAILTK